MEKKRKNPTLTWSPTLPRKKKEGGVNFRCGDRRQEKSKKRKEMKLLRY